MIDGQNALMARIEKEGLTDGALEALEVLEVGLHGSMIANMKNPLIETTAQRLKNYVTLIRLARLVTAPLALRTLGEHLEVLEAFVSRAPDRADTPIPSPFQAAHQK